MGMVGPPLVGENIFQMSRSGREPADFIRRMELEECKTSSTILLASKDTQVVHPEAARDAAAHLLYRTNARETAGDL